METPNPCEFFDYSVLASIQLCVRCDAIMGNLEGGLCDSCKEVVDEAVFEGDEVFV